MSADPTARRIDDVLGFWFGPEPLRPRGEVWFRADASFDAEVRERFEREVERAAAGQAEAWAESPRGALALVILLDQLTRNIYRDTPRAFAHDQAARRVAKRAIERGFHRALPPLMRAFLYMPLMHSEDPADHERSIALFEELAREATEEIFGHFLDHARRHKAVVDRFGRYPHRNEVLGRRSTQEERAFLRERGRGF